MGNEHTNGKHLGGHQPRQQAKLQGTKGTVMEAQASAQRHTGHKKRQNQSNSARQLSKGKNATWRMATLKHNGLTKGKHRRGTGHRKKDRRTARPTSHHVQAHHRKGSKHVPRQNRTAARAHELKRTRRQTKQR
ncbi:hypothetical protein TRVL_09316 [Trypanosoma vivax]|nr:hypothetical protein TRVL_09316 [Trypanosoma vivax]